MTDKNVFPLLSEIPCKIGECIFPDERDKLFSQQIAKRIYGVLASIFPNYGYFSFSIEEKYLLPLEKTPHFQFQINFGQDSSLVFYNSMGLVAKYKANDGEKDYEGATTMWIYSDLIESNLSILFGFLFCIYDEAIREFYTEWETQYGSKYFEFEKGTVCRVT